MTTANNEVFAIGRGQFSVFSHKLVQLPEYSIHNKLSSHKNKFDCLVHEMLLIRVLIQSDSIPEKLFV